MELSELLREAKAPPSRGRRKTPISVELERPLTQADINTLWDLPDGALGSQTPHVQKLRDRHHQLARLLAGGTPESEAALITGYQISRISILKNDPAFKELLAYYQGQKELVFIDFFEKLKQLGVTCFQEIMDRLEEDPEQFSLEDLREFLVVASDRTGHGPAKSIAANLNIGVVTMQHLTKIKEEVSKRQNGTVERLDSKDSRSAVGALIESKPLAEEAEVLEPAEKRPGV